jgi:hypothetical protein
MPGAPSQSFERQRIGTPGAPRARAGTVGDEAHRPFARERQTAGCPSPLSGAWRTELNSVG